MGQNRDLSRFPNAITVLDNGNVGIGNTNSFAGATSLTGLAISDRGGLFKLAVNDVMYLSNNLYYDGTNWKRIVAGGGMFMQLESVDGGTLRVFSAATGTAGSNATTVDRLMINSSGNVGIGTSSPSAKLTLIGGEMRWGFTSDMGSLSYTGGNPMIQSVGALDLQFNTNSLERMRITSSGNVGIGISNPSYKLHIPQGNDLYLSNLYITGTANNPLLDSGATGGSIGLYGGGNGAGRIFLQGAAVGGGGYIKLDTDGSERMRITSAGNVGIGTSSPNGNLQFSNNINNRKIVLYQGGNNNFEFYGFGVDSATLVYTTYTTGDDHVFFAGAGPTSRNELMRIKGTGQVLTPNQPAFSVFRKGVDNRSGLMTYTNTILNRGNCVNLGNGRFTAPVSGAYQISFMGFQQVGNSGILSIVLYRNGVNTFIRTYQDDPNSAYGPHATISVVVSLNANDYVYISVDAGEIHANDDAFFSGFLIG